MTSPIHSCGSLPEFHSERDREFLERVLETGLDRYVAWIEQLSFTGMARVLDAGCGFGQWTRALAERNSRALGIDTSQRRVQVSRALFETGTCNFVTGSIDMLPAGDASFDGVFSFSAIYYANVKRTISEFARVLRPGGRLYLCTNGLGWYLYNLVHNPNPSADYSPRSYAIRTLMHYAVGYPATDVSTVMTPEKTAHRLRGAGFESVEVLDRKSPTPPLGLFPRRYAGMSSVFEMAAVRGDQTS